MRLQGAIGRLNRRTFLKLSAAAAASPTLARLTASPAGAASGAVATADVRGPAPELDRLGIARL
ncbi:MAG: twin-arginine translocation signal domain-containing protein, partial [Thermomicrobiaceae bacterium]|nr:twin-arginine translocation signal domain-containing protein [Thermomicrobiaceae bacterium]